MYRDKRFKYFRKPGSKYKNVMTTLNGQKYHSKFEAQVSQDLDLKVKAGIYTHYERQVRISLDVLGHHVCNYYMDFVAYLPDGRAEYIEVKGFETETWRLKWKLFEAIYGHDHNNILTIIRR